MKSVAILLSLLIPASAVGQTTSASVLPSTAPAGVSLSTASAGILEPFTIIAPMLKQERPVKIARATGGLVALSGVGLLVYAVVFVGTGPIGWATGLIFFGGLTAYLAHRQLHGKNDFKPNPDEAPAPDAQSGADASPERGVQQSH